MCSAVPAQRGRRATNYRGAVLNYREQLRAPASYWGLGLLSAAMFAATVWAGLSAAWVIVTWVFIVGGCCAGLLLWGRVRVEVTSGALRAGRAVLPLQDTGEVTALDAVQTRALRGPRADPAAFMLTRPYLKLGVYVEVTASEVGTPYWLIATRRPAELAAAIETSRRAAHTGGSTVA
jgi:hypothetical protein